MSLIILIEIRVDVQYYVTFRYSTQRFDICIHYEMITMSSNHLSPYTVVISSALHAVYYIPVVYCFCRGEIDDVVVI